MCKTMTANKFPYLFQFFGAYFHQDWDLEAQEDEGIIRNYLQESSLTAVKQTITEITQLLAMNFSEKRLKKFLIHELGCFYNPTSKGISYQDWLLWIENFIKKETSIS